MNLTKAISKLEDLLRYAYEPETEQAHDALRQGIEALKKELQTRQEYPDLDWTLLPGETKD